MSCFLSPWPRCAVLGPRVPSELLMARRSRREGRSAAGQVLAGEAPSCHAPRAVAAAATQLWAGAQPPARRRVTGEVGGAGTQRSARLTCAFSRRVVDVLLKAIMRTMWFVGGFHHVVVKGRQAPPTEAAILTLAPHSSYFDAIPVTMTMSSIVMKAESRDIPIWGSE